VVVTLQQKKRLVRSQYSSCHFYAKNQ
jgi:hypothetical protein